MPDYKPEECIYDKSYTCPVCEENFKAKQIRKGRAKFVSNDDDLKPNYTPVNPDYYDVIICDNCGYAAISSKFETISMSQQEAVEKEITPNYIKKEYPNIYDADTAIERYMIALKNCEAKKSKAGEIAYIHLKLAWIYRDKKDRRSELENLKLAYEGFNTAFTTEKLPICGLDENTLLYILAAIGIEIGQVGEGVRILSRLMVKKNLSSRFKDKIANLREKVRESLK